MHEGVCARGRCVHVDVCACGRCVHVDVCARGCLCPGMCVHVGAMCTAMCVQWSHAAYILSPHPVSVETGTRCLRCLTRRLGTITTYF